MAAIPVDPREELERLERKHAENPEGRYFVPLADAYRRSGDLSEAIDLLRAGLARHPDYLSAHVVLGRCYADSGDPDAAEAEFRYILSLDPQNLVALRTLGDIALVDGRRHEAERWYNDLLAVDPMNDDARAALQQLRAQGSSGSGDDGLGATIPAPAGEARPAGQMRRDQPFAGGYGLGERRADSGLGSDDDRSALFDDDSDAVVTETIAELYTRQGFFDRAADVYRQLIRRRGGDDALEARLRRVQALAAGLPADAGDMATSAEPRFDVPDGIGLETASAPGGEDDAVEWDAQAREQEGLAVSDPSESLFPLIGPAGDAGADELDALTLTGEAESPLPPAYDFSMGEIGEDARQSGDSDDLDDLLIDPYADPFGAPVSPSSADLSARSFASTGEWPGGPGDSAATGGTGPDPFADSFSDGFPLLDEVPSTTTGATSDASGSEATDVAAGGITSPPDQLPIGAFLKSVATWSRSVRPGAVGSSSGAAESETLSGLGGTGWPAMDEAPQSEHASYLPDEEPEELTTPDATPDQGGDVGLEGGAGEAAGSRVPDTYAGTSSVALPTDWSPHDAEFDAALGHASSSGPGQDDAVTREATPSEPSGADDLQLVGGVDDLFPWEIPVPEPDAQALPPVQRLDLDPGYPFDDTPRAEAPFVDETVHSERSPSDVLEPELPRDAAEPMAELGQGEIEEVAVTSGSESGDGGENNGASGTSEAAEPSIPPADGQDDDDLESFQAWLRSLKR